MSCTRMTARKATFGYVPPRVLVTFGPTVVVRPSCAVIVPWRDEKLHHSESFDAGKAPLML